MQGVGSIIKVFAGLGVIGALIFLYYFSKGVHEDYLPDEQVSEEQLERLIDDENVQEFEPGQKEFHRALELIATGRLEEAKDRLTFIQRAHPTSANGPEARRILGEINLDALLSIENLTNKQRHIVKSGDNFTKITKKYGTSLENIMFLNGLMGVRTLHPGDDLIVMPLNFKLVLDLARSRVELHGESGLIKEYPIKKIDLPKLGKRKYSGKIGLKVAEIRGRHYNPMHPKFRHGIKVLGFKIKRTQIQIRPVPAADEEDPGRGIFLASTDMEELSMLIRQGNEVEIKPAG